MCPFLVTTRLSNAAIIRPGMHGDKGRRKQSEYATALGEKQKLRLMYGLLEKQFRRYYEIALSKRGVSPARPCCSSSRRAWTTSFSASVSAIPAAPRARWSITATST